MRRFFIGLGLALLTLLLIVGSAFFYAQSQVFRQKEPTITSTGIAASFKDIAELAVEEYTFTNVGKFADEGHQIYGLTVPLTGKNFLITYDGTVKAGVKDFSQIAIDMSENTKKVTLKVPRVEIIDSKIDPDSVIVYDQSYNPLNQLSVDDMTRFLTVEGKAAETQAIEHGILKRAGERVEQLLDTHIKSLLLHTDKEDYEVTVTWK
ncbi:MULTISPECIES: DUF4230 domain-containing protein [unclassified Corynebacterium]|uniref:DUF4230 domain-containing protein n=1 Tax=unclassified Corynebacterium TaxID=2624378 RepID=UPI002169F431|nr:MULTISPECIES: DUF4230 domain-containing protein [unclassified Corynebacterium]MCS4491366.1 DUF4230 domain-containing protein [Corynebacterium sp. ES2715-CONJ3]MCS4531536.1 DUF4230 domain-containing protein [Corynebacterium sp. ES2730-CONJ]